MNPGNLSDTELKNILLELGVTDDFQLKKAEEYVAREKTNLYEALIEMDFISDENLGKLIASHINLPYVNLAKTAISKETLELIPELVAKKHGMVAFAHDAAGVKVGTTNPFNQEVFQLLSKKLGEKVEIFFATERDLDNVLHLYHTDLQKSFDNLIKDQVAEAGTASNKSVPIAKIVDLLISYAYEDKASDIHIEPEEFESSVRFRIDGVLHDVLVFSKDLHDQIITRIKVLSKLRTDEHMRAQDSKLQIPMQKENLDVRVSITPIVNGEKAVLRLLSSRSRQFSLIDLGLAEKDLEKVTKAFKSPHGMILATGPTGSGKSTSIYAILKLLNSREKNIATIEDPVEYDIAGINQIQVNTKTNLTFADGLRSILRQDPDIIFVGEIRDGETAGIAINAALTGHLVLSTLHTNDAPTTIPRLIDMNIEPFLVASTVNVIVAQRLVRKICESCRVSNVVPIAELEKKLSKIDIKKLTNDATEARLYSGKGCPVCHNSGYFGRIGIFEVLEMSPAIRELISTKANSDIIRKQAIKEGMTTMYDDGLIKVQNGLTTIEEIIRVAKS
jgi:type IV pilus assembly protein PilB